MVSLVRLIRRLFVDTEPPRPPPDLTDDLLEDIFLRISSHADLARASAACSTFHRLVTGRSFLRRYRSLHPPLLLGFVSSVSEGFHPAEAPHPNAPTAHSFARAADFSFGYLPHPHRWSPCDVRDGRVLLARRQDSGGLPDLAVCDPLSRLYLLLPSVPYFASFQVQQGYLGDFGAFLVPTGEEDDETSFRVISKYDILWGGASVVFVFSSASGRWTPSAFANLGALELGGCRHLPRAQCVYGCFYWRLECRDKLLKLDMSRMEFSTVDLPPDHYGGKGGQEVAVVEAGEDRLGMFSHKRKHDTSVHYSIRQSDDKGGNEWRTENTIPLPDHYNFRIIGAPEGYIFLLGTPKVRFTMHAVWFSLEIKTMKIERVMTHRGCELDPYFRFMPSLSPRRI